MTSPSQPTDNRPRRRGPLWVCNLILMTSLACPAASASSASSSAASTSSTPLSAPPSTPSLAPSASSSTPPSSELLCGSRRSSRSIHRSMVMPGLSFGISTTPSATESSSLSSSLSSSSSWENVRAGSTSSTSSTSAGPMSSFQSLPILSSSLVSILGRSIHLGMTLAAIATTAMIGSGWLGAHIASSIIARIARIATIATIADGKMENSANFLPGLFILSNNKFQWTILSTVWIVAGSIIRGTFDDVPFLALLWIHSYISYMCSKESVEAVNRTELSGLIGVSHALLGMISFLSCRLGEKINDLGGLRLTPLDDEKSDAEMKEMKEDRKVGGINRMDIPSIRCMASNALSSVSLLTLFPQYFLGLYFLSTIGLKFIGNIIDNSRWNTKTDKWHRYTSWLVWWEEGFIIDPQEGVDVGSLSWRLFLVHWGIMIVKGSVAFLLKL